MKKLIIMSAIAMSGLIYNTADAQIGIRVGLNFGSGIYCAPAPVVVERAPVYEYNDYYYLPDVDAYYNVDERCYYYNDGEDWVSAAYLPGYYRDYDWRNERHFEVRANCPYLHDNFYRSRYNGHAFSEWSHSNYNNHVDHGYGDRGYRDNQRYDNHWQVNNDRRYDDGGNRANVQRYDNREQRFAQPVPSYRAQGYEQRFENHGQGNLNQPNHIQGNEQRPDNHGQNYNSQPANQNQGRDNRAVGDHYVQNSPQSGLSEHRMARF